jgi:hypothetical protein
VSVGVGEKKSDLHRSSSSTKPMVLFISFPAHSSLLTPWSIESLYPLSPADSAES